MTVTRDAQSGWYCPATAAEWTQLLAGSGIGTPSNLWNCQDASGSLTDAIGTAPLGYNGTAGQEQYQQPVPGWSRFAVTTGLNQVCQFFSTSATLPDISTTSALLLIYWAGPMQPLASGGTLNVAAVGGAAGRAFIETSQGKAITPRIFSTTNSASGTASLDNTVQLFALRINVTTSAVVYNDLFQQVSPTFGTMSGPEVILGSASARSEQQGFLLAALWSGASAELTDAQLATLYDLIQNGPAVFPNFEDVVAVQAPNTLLVQGEAIQIGNDAGAKSFVFSNNLAALHFAANPSSNHTIVLPDASGTVGLITGISAVGSNASTGLVVFSNSNNVSFGLDNSGNVTASASFAVPGFIPVAAVGVSTGGNTAGNTGTTFGQVVFAGQGLIVRQTTAAGSQATINLNPSEQTAPSAIIAGTQTATSGTVVLSNSNGLSFGMSGSHTVTASYDYIRSISASGSNITGSQVIFSNSHGISFGANGGTVTAQLPSVRYWENRHDLVQSFQMGTLLGGASNMLIQRISVPFPLQATQLDFVGQLTLAATGTSGGYSAYGGIYTFAGSTASSVSSGSIGVAIGVGSTTTGTFFGAQSGARWRSIPIGTWNVTPGEYLVGFVVSALFGLSAVGLQIYGGSSLNISGSNNYSVYFADGAYSSAVSGNVLPAVVNLSDVIQTAGLAQGQPYIRLIGSG